MSKGIGILLAAGKGIRFGGDVPKQFIEINGKPMIWYSLKAFEESIADDVVLVMGEEYIGFCRDLVAESGFTKVRAIVTGGKLRYDSVYEGIKAAGEACGAKPDDIVLIHDGARPMVSPNLIGRCMVVASECRAAAAAVPVIDTIRTAENLNYGGETLDRSRLRAMQTPQAFTYEVARMAYDQLSAFDGEKSFITDDVMVVDWVLGIPSKFVEGEKKNIKVTTAEDVALAEWLLRT